MSKKWLLTIVLLFTLFSSLMSPAFADLYVKPGRLGILRLTISPLFPAKATGTFSIGNTYNFSLTVSLETAENVTGIMSLSESNFTLQPNETKKIDFDVEVADPGVYDGYVLVTAKKPSEKTTLGYQLYITIIVTKSGFDLPSLALLGIVSAGAVGLVYFVFKKSKTRKTKTRILQVSIFLAFSLLFASPAFAANVGMVVKDKTNLSPMHEAPIYNILNDMHHSVTLIDATSNVDYYDFDLLVIAGRPISSSDGGLGDFVANIPVNDIPTIGIDYRNLDNWGWVEMSGRSSYGSSRELKVYIKKTHPITRGFPQDQSVYVHIMAGWNAVDMVKGGTNFDFVATADSTGNLGMIAYASPNTVLSNGEQVGENSALVFFGITYPIYWTNDAVILFKNSVNWLLSLEFIPPSTPTLLRPTSTRTSTATYEWSEANDNSGVLNYQFQLSDSPDFNTSLVDVEVNGLGYTASGLEDGKIYYARVRAVDFYGNEGNWSNTLKTVADFSNFILTILSPANGTELHLGDNIFVDVNVNAPRLADGSNCTISTGGEFVANISYNQTLKKCSSNITIPTTLGQGAFGFTPFTVSATNSLGNTNSSSVTIFFNRSIAVSVSTDKTSYAPGENVIASGFVTLTDNNAKVSDATINYSISGTAVNGTVKTDATGLYSFVIGNLAQGSYTVNINANYNVATASASAIFTISQPQPSAPPSSGSSSGSSSGTSYVAILSIDVPSEMTVYKDSDNVFFVKMKNEGTIALRAAKISINDIGFPYDVDPDMVDIGIGSNYNFKVTLHVPKVNGTYYMDVNGLAYGAFQRTAKVKLTVLPELLIPVLEFSDPELSAFTEGQSAHANITISNKGNATAEANVSIILPNGWIAEKYAQSVIIEQGSQQKISFILLPSNVSGDIKFNADYFADGQKKSVSMSEIATVNPPESVIGMITGLFVKTLSKPEVYIPASLAIIAVVTYILRKRIGKEILVKKTVTARQTIHEKAVSNYKKWEKKQKKR